MFGVDRLKLAQPVTQKPVYEFVVSNWFGKWMHRKNWGAVTLPLGPFVVIFYWCQSTPLERVHEFVHVAQSERPGGFFLQYAVAMEQGHGYSGNPLEREAYAAETYAAVNGLPAWAKNPS